MRLAAEEVLHRLDHFRHARHAADENHLVDLGSLQTGVLQCVLAGADGLLDEVIDQVLSLARVSFMVRCFGPVLSAVMKGRLISVCVVDDNSILAFSAASFSRCSASLSPRRSMPKLLELIGEIVDEGACRNPRRRGRYRHWSSTPWNTPSPIFEDRDIEGAAAEVVDGDGLALFLLVEAVSERGRGQLSLMICRTFFDPAISAASLVAWRWASLKSAGTVMTACSTFSPR